MNQARPFSEGFKLTGLEIFAIGNHRGRAYTTADLVQIARNFDLFSSPRAKKILLHVPCVIGHEEDQAYLERTDLPAAGWITRVYANKDGILMADAEGVPAQVARLIKGGAYKTVSAEIYDTPPDGIPAQKGTKMLRRVAFLGAEIPEVKGLAEIPTPEPYSERRAFASAWQGALRYRGRAKLPSGAYAVFSERVTKMAQRSPAVGQRVVSDKRRSDGTPRASGRVRSTLAPNENDRHGGATVNDVSGEVRGIGQNQIKDDKGKRFGQYDEEAAPMREDHCKKLAEHGMDSKILDEMPDHHVAHVSQVMDDARSPMEEDDEEKWPMPKDEEEEEHQQFRERARKYLERAKKFAAKYGEMDDLDLDEDEEERKRRGEEPAMMSEKHLSPAARREFAKLVKFREETESMQKALLIETFCEAQAQAGRLGLDEYRPRSRGGPGGLVYERLTRADSRDRAIKFSEKGKTASLTELEVQMREIERRRSMFAERFAQRDSGKNSGAADVELDKVQRFSESSFLASALEATGKTPEDFVAAFVTITKTKPRITAVEYGVPDFFV